MTPAAPRLGAPVVLAALAVCIAACGSRPPPPPRGVVEGDVGEWKFRRFQPVLDVEVWIDRNPAEAFTATYVREDAEKRGRLADDDLVSVFVTRYEKDAAVARETVKFARRLAAEAGYQVEELRTGGVRAVRIVGHGEAWLLWAAPRHVVKVGGRGRDDIPDAVVAYYGERYPSTLPSGVLEGPLPPGPDDPAAPGQPYDPDSPAPDWDTYDPAKAKPPARKD
jgi:hypothetical protein